MSKKVLSGYEKKPVKRVHAAEINRAICSWINSMHISPASLIDFQRLKVLIYDQSEYIELLEAEIEADESNFGGRRKRKRGGGFS